jgi:probable F420-dependent oxidoreductase
LRLETILADITVGKYLGEGQARTSVERTAAAARQIEDLGFDGLTTPEAGHDPFLPLAIAAEHTSRVSLGTNVAIAFPRSPMSVAQTAWDLQQISAGRFKLGLGTQVKGHNERRYSTPWPGPPGPRLREYLLCLKAIFATFQNATKPQYFQGEHYKFTLLPPFFNPGPIDHPHVPLYISGLNPYMARLAGELCDGLRLHPLATLPFTKDVVLPAIEEGAKKAGRQVSEIDIVGSPFLVTGRDEAELEAAKRGTKQQIAFYSSTRTYHAVLEHHGWGEVGRKLHEMSLQGQWGEMAPLISDEMLDAFAVVAPLDDLVPRVRERWGGVLDTLFLGLPPAAQEDESQLRSIIEALRA